MKLSKRVLDRIGGQPIDKNELDLLLHTKADKTDLVAGLNEKVSLSAIVKNRKIMANIQNQIKHLIMITSEWVRYQICKPNTTLNEAENINFYLLERIEEIYKWVWESEQKLFHESNNDKTETEEKFEEINTQEKTSQSFIKNILKSHSRIDNLSPSLYNTGKATPHHSSIIDHNDSLMAPILHKSPLQIQMIKNEKHSRTRSSSVIKQRITSRNKLTKLEKSNVDLTSKRSQEMNEWDKNELASPKLHIECKHIIQNENQSRRKILKSVLFDENALFMNNKIPL